MREKANLEFENSLPMSRKKFIQLFDYFDEKLSKKDCDDSLKLTTEFLQENHMEEIENWLQEKGGYCDCEVLNNVEEMFEDGAII